jgi:hypothetical protein
MRDLEHVIEQARRDAADKLRAELRLLLLAQPQDWLVDQLIEQILGRTELAGVIPAQREPAHQVCRLPLDEARLAQFVKRYAALDRAQLEADRFLFDPPMKGGPLIGDEHRSPEAAVMLAEAKDLLYALLFGGDMDEVRLSRTERQLLTLTVPRAKSAVFGFLSSAATGTADDDRPSRTLLQVEYGEIADEGVGRGIVAALRVINDLELNEQIPYARMENAEKSTLI